MGKINRSLLLSLFLIVFHCLNYAQDWHWSLPYPQGNLFESLYFLDADTGYIVGQHGSILMTQDGGTTWDIQTSPVYYLLTSVTFADKDLGIIVGYNGTILQTTNGGETWENRSVDAPVSFNAVDLYDTVTGYAVAWNNEAGQGQIYRTTDAGASWQVVFTTSSYFYAVSAPGPDTVYVAGWEGMFCRTINGGDDWQEEDIGTTIYSLCFTNTLHGVAVGRGEEAYEALILSTFDGGLTWDSHPEGNIPPLYFYSVHFSSDLTGYAIGGYDGSDWDAAVIKTTDGGLIWNLVPESPGKEMYAVFSVDDGTVYCTGSDGRIARTVDSGETWEAKSSELIDNYSSVVATGPYSAYAGGVHSIVETSNGGLDWEEEIPWAFNDYDYLTVYFVDEQKGFAAGALGHLYFTNDGGTSWGGQFVAYPQLLCSISIPQQSDSGYVVGDAGTVIKFNINTIGWRQQYNGTSWKDLYSVHFPVIDTGYITGEGGTVWKTTSGGNLWEPLNSGTTQPLRSAYFLDAVTGFIVGGNGIILKTEDGGLSWIPQNSGTNVSLNSVYFQGENFGYIAGNSGTILHSTDGGINWEKQESPTWNDLKSVFIYDTSLVYVAGDNAILKSSEPGFVQVNEKDIARKDGLIISPNPMHYAAQVIFDIDSPGIVDISLYDMRGTRVRSVLHNFLPGGQHRIAISRETLPQGIYLLRMTDGRQSFVKKLIATDN